MNAQKKQLLREQERKREVVRLLKSFFRRPIIYIAAIVIALTCFPALRIEASIKLNNLLEFVHLKAGYTSEDLLGYYNLGSYGDLPVYGNPKGIISPKPLDLDPTKTISDINLLLNALGFYPGRVLSTYDLLGMTPEEVNNVHPWSIDVISEMIFDGLSGFVPATGLKDSVNTILEVDACVEKCTKVVIENTNHDLPLFKNKLEQYGNSEAKFRISALISYLRRDLGIKYDPKWAAPPEYRKLWDDYKLREDGDVFWRDPERLFLRGVFKNKGSCSSLPVLTIAIGRRLGYPLKLVSAKEHLFARWESTNEVFNIECTADGVSFHSDDYYRTGYFAATDEEISEHNLLRSMTQAEELAMLCHARGICLLYNHYIDHSIVWVAKAMELQKKSGLIAKCIRDMQPAREDRVREELIMKITREGNMGWDKKNKFLFQNGYKGNHTSTTIVLHNAAGFAPLNPLDDSDEQMLASIRKRSQPKLPKGAIYAP